MRKLSDDEDAKDDVSNDQANDVGVDAIAVGVGSLLVDNDNDNDDKDKDGEGKNSRIIRARLSVVERPEQAGDVSRPAPLQGSSLMSLQPVVAPPST